MARQRSFCHPVDAPCALPPPCLQTTPPAPATLPVENIRLLVHQGRGAGTPRDVPAVRSRVRGRRRGPRGWEWIRCPGPCRVALRRLGRRRGRPRPPRPYTGRMLRPYACRWKGWASQQKRGPARATGWGAELQCCLDVHPHAHPPSAAWAAACRCRRRCALCSPAERRSGRGNVALQTQQGSSGAARPARALPRPAPPQAHMLLNQKTLHSKLNTLILRRVPREEGEPWQGMAGRVMLHGRLAADSRAAAAPR